MGLHRGEARVCPVWWKDASDAIDARCPPGSKGIRPPSSERPPARAEAALVRARAGGPSRIHRAARTAPARRRARRVDRVRDAAAALWSAGTTQLRRGRARSELLRSLDARKRPAQADTSGGAEHGRWEPGVAWRLRVDRAVCDVAVCDDGLSWCWSASERRPRRRWRRAPSGSLKAVVPRMNFGAKSSA